MLLAKNMATPMKRHSLFLNFNGYCENVVECVCVTVTVKSYNSDSNNINF